MLSDTLGALGYESIRKRLVGLKGVNINLSAQEILALKPEERPKQLRFVREQGFIVVDPPYTDDDLAPKGRGLLGNVSLDLELGDTLRIHGNPHTHPENRDGFLEDPIVDITNPRTVKRIEKQDTLYKIGPGQCYVLVPGALVKAYTLRYYFMPYNLMGLVVGRSKLGRFGVTTTVDAPKIDPGFSGRIVLEIAHLGAYRFALRVGMPLSQIIFLTVEGRIGTPYDENHDPRRQEGINYAVAPTSFFSQQRVERVGIEPLFEQGEKDF